MMKKNNSEKVIKKEFKYLNPAPVIRLGNDLMDAMMFVDNVHTDAPIIAWRIAFEISSIVRNEQFQPNDASRYKQLELFEETFVSEHNTFSQFSIRTKNILGNSRNSKALKTALQWMENFDKGWHTLKDKNGTEFSTLSGMISMPTVVKKGRESWITFLMPANWMKKMLLIPSYNKTEYELCHKFSNNSQLTFSLWILRLIESGTYVSLENMNQKYNFHYKSINQLVQSFIKPIKVKLESFAAFSFDYRVENNRIFIKRKVNNQNLTIVNSKNNNRYRINYFKTRFNIDEEDLVLLKQVYNLDDKTKILIDEAYNAFNKNCRYNKISHKSFKGQAFLKQLQLFIIQLYSEKSASKMFPNGYPKIIQNQ